MSFFTLVWSNLKRKKLRTTLTILSISVAFVLFCLLSALKFAFGVGPTLADANRLITRHRVSFIQPLPVSYRARIERMPGVDAVAHWTWFNGIYQDPKNQFGSFPVEPESFLDMHPEYRVSPETLAAWKNTRTGAVIGPNLVQRFGWKVGDRVPLVSVIWPNKTDEAWTFDIVGVYERGRASADPNAFFFRYDYFDEGRRQGEGLIGWFQVRVSDPQRAPEIAAAIDAEFANSPAETKTETEAALFQSFAQQIGDIGAIATAILAAVFFTILLVAGNTMAQSVRERVQEIGVLKALGFSNGIVLGIVLCEALLIALLGGGLGLGFGSMVVSGLAQSSDVRTIFPILTVPPRDVAIGVALASVLGLAAGLMPALQAQRLRLAESLRRDA